MRISSKLPLGYVAACSAASAPEIAASALEVWPRAPMRPRLLRPPRLSTGRSSIAIPTTRLDRKPSTNPCHPQTGFAQPVADGSLRSARRLEQRIGSALLPPHPEQHAKSGRPQTVPLGVPPANTDQVRGRLQFILKTPSSPQQWPPRDGSSAPHLTLVTIAR